MLLTDILEMPPKREKRVLSDADDDDDYKRKREKNNEAVKKSRDKYRKHTQEISARVAELKVENQKLEEKKRTLTKQLMMLDELAEQLKK